MTRVWGRVHSIVVLESCIRIKTDPVSSAMTEPPFLGFEGVFYAFAQLILCICPIDMACSRRSIRKAATASKSRTVGLAIVAVRHNTHRTLRRMAHSRGNSLRNTGPHNSGRLRSPHRPRRQPARPLPNPDLDSPTLLCLCIPSRRRASRPTEPELSCPQPSISSRPRWSAMEPRGDQWTRRSQHSSRSGITSSAWYSLISSTE